MLPDLHHLLPSERPLTPPPWNDYLERVRHWHETSPGSSNCPFKRAVAHHESDAIMQAVSEVSQ